MDEMLLVKRLGDERAVMGPGDWWWIEADGWGSGSTGMEELSPLTRMPGTLLPWLRFKREEADPGWYGCCCCWWGYCCWLGYCC